MPHLFRKLVQSVTVVSALLLATGSAQAQETPTKLNGGKVVTVDEAKKVLDGGSSMFVDTRAVLNFGKGHVPGAIAVAYKEKSEKVEAFDAAQDGFELAKLPADKAKGIVFYSDGPTGWKSYKAAVLAIKAGHKNVMYMRGGFSEWTAKGFPSES
jgi:3-mercaptopyruvate sulfurtransferase SseA